MSDLEKKNGRAEGICFVGVCAATKTFSGVVALIASDVAELEASWACISMEALDKSLVRRVAIFHEDDMTSNEKVPQ